MEISCFNFCMGSSLWNVMKECMVFIDSLCKIFTEHFVVSIEIFFYRFYQPQAPALLAKPRQINKPIRHHTYSKMVDKEIPKKIKDGI